MAKQHPRIEDAHRDFITRQHILFTASAAAGARQIVLLDVDLVQTSCGFGVPFFDYKGERKSMDRWADAKTEAELEAYRREYNALSLDGLPTGLLEDEDTVAR